MQAFGFLGDIYNTAETIKNGTSLGQVFFATAENLGMGLFTTALSTNGDTNETNQQQVTVDKIPPVGKSNDANNGDTNNGDTKDDTNNNATPGESGSKSDKPKPEPRPKS